MEQRPNIKFCFKTGKTTTETFRMITQAYSENAFSCMHVPELFKDGHEGLQDAPRRYHPSASQNEDTELQ
jgi:hypothetical protein